ncbi:MAG TPA: anti-sigma factor [Vicinamibacterales bacterium]|nr:anti-sigma factor [Vicinamibacterales bacterium]
MHSDLKDDASAYALDSLDAGDRASFEAHLAECDECAGEVRSLRRVAVAVARSVPQPLPPPELRRRVLQSLTGGPATHTKSSAVENRWRTWLPLAATLIVAVGAGVHAARLQIRVDDLEVRLQQALVQASAADRAVGVARRVGAELQVSMSVLAAPDLVRIDLTGQPAAPRARGRALWSRARGMIFTAAALPPLPAGQVYQVWVVTQPGPVSAGLLTPDVAGGDLIFFETPPDIPPPTAVAVTIEPAGGLPAPTGAFYLIGSPGAAL